LRLVCYEALTAARAASPNAVNPRIAATQKPEPDSQKRGSDKEADPTPHAVGRCDGKADHDGDDENDRIGVYATREHVREPS
jgi:hypothetical protein